MDKSKAFVTEYRDGSLVVSRDCSHICIATRPPNLRYRPAKARALAAYINKMADQVEADRG